MIRLRQPQPLQFIAPIDKDPEGRSEADSIRVGGKWAPGLWVISGAAIPINWQQQNGFGTVGATLVYTGQSLVEFNAEVKIHTDAQMDAYLSWEKSTFVFSKPPPVVTHRVVPPNEVKRVGQEASLKLMAGGLGLTELEKRKLEAQVLAARDYAVTDGYFPKPLHPVALGIYHPLLVQLNVTMCVAKKIHQFVNGTGAASGMWTKTIEFIQYREMTFASGRVDGAIPDSRAPAPTAQNETERNTADVQDKLARQRADLARRGH